MIPEEFKDIRPFEPEELPEAIDRIFSSEQFRTILPYIFPEIPVEILHKKMKEVKNSMEFQRAFSYHSCIGCLIKHLNRFHLTVMRSTKASISRS